MIFLLNFNVYKIRSFAFLLLFDTMNTTSKIINTQNKLLIRNGYLPISGSRNHEDYARTLRTNPSLITVIQNMIKYGYMPSEEAVSVLSKLETSQLITFWNELEPALKSVTSADMNVGDAVVYKNFPREVLDMSECEYWTKQILMYFGFSADYFTEEVEDRKSAIEDLPVKVLRLSTTDTLTHILNNLYASPATWTSEQEEDVEFLVCVSKLVGDVDTCRVKENLVKSITLFFEKKISLDVKVSPTDVLRFAYHLSGGDVSLKEKTKLINFNRPTRKFILGLLEVHGSSSLIENFFARKEQWKRLLERLHVGDYLTQFPTVAVAQRNFYAGNGTTRNGKIEAAIKNKDTNILGQLSAGEYMRRLFNLYGTMGSTAFKMFVLRLPELTVLQLAKTKQLLLTSNDRKTRMFAPNGNWSRVQIATNTTNINKRDIDFVVNAIDIELGLRFKDYNIVTDGRLSNIKIQTNDSDLMPYGRGTVIDIPDGVNFIRTASHWKAPNGRKVWFDNGWNFFDNGWNSQGTCCWNSNPTGIRSKGKYVVFSGDPVTALTKNNEGAQMIDIYIDKALANGIRYAVWNVLCYSRIAFDDVPFIHASLQWGDDAQAKELFSPDRCVLNFPLKGKNMTKYVAILDVVERKIIYMDANLRGDVRSAKQNVGTLTETMPAYMEYLNSIPSLETVFGSNTTPTSEDFTYIGVDDDNVSLDGNDAWVFKQTNDKNKFTQVNINKLLTQ